MIIYYEWVIKTQRLYVPNRPHPVIIDHLKITTATTISILIDGFVIPQSNDNERRMNCCLGASGPKPDPSNNNDNIERVRAWAINWPALIYTFVICVELVIYDR